MFKVSFRDFDGPSKKVQTFNDRVTIVTLKGRMALPNWWYNIPSDILDWVRRHPSIDAWESLANNELVIVVQGKTIRAEEDEDNPVIAERIAESRAKIRLYKFLEKLCEKLMKYYYGIMYGNAEFDVIRESHSEEPKDCIYLACKKYRELWIKEFHHLGKLLEES